MNELKSVENLCPDPAQEPISVGGLPLTPTRSPSDGAKEKVSLTRPIRAGSGLKPGLGTVAPAQHAPKAAPLPERERLVRGFLAVGITRRSRWRSGFQV